jgi:hypothetical protein
MPYFFYLWVEDGFIRSNPNQRDQQKEAGEGGGKGEGLTQLSRGIFIKIAKLPRENDVCISCYGYRLRTMALA